MQPKFVTTYRELQQWRKPTVRDKARSIALSALALVNKLEGAEDKYLSKPRIQFLYLHHIFKDEEHCLQKLLEKLAEKHTFISYSEAADKIKTGTIDRPYICFSSDDGLKNNIAAAEILNRYNAKACFFINPPLIGETNYEKLKAHCLHTLDFPVVEFLDWKEIEQLQAWGHEIGGHTMHHINIAQTPTDIVIADMHETRAVLQQHCGASKHFAFPFGRFFHFSEVGRKAAFDAGYSTCASAERGCHINPESQIGVADLCIRRDNTVLAWDIDHIMYFIINNAKRATITNNLFPPLI